MEMYDYCLNQFIKVVLIKMNAKTFYSYQFSGTNIAVYLNRTYSLDIAKVLDTYGSATFSFASTTAQTDDVYLKAYANFLDDIS